MNKVSCTIADNHSCYLFNIESFSSQILDIVCRLTYRVVSHCARAKLYLVSPLLPDMRVTALFGLKGAQKFPIFCKKLVMHLIFNQCMFTLSVILIFINDSNRV